MKNNLYWSDTYLSFTEGSVSVLSGQRAVKGASLSATYSAKVNKQKHLIPSNAKFSSNTKALIHFKRH